MMPGVTMQEIRDAITETFDEAELTMAVQFVLDENLDNIVRAGPFKFRVFELVKWADREGRASELVQALAKSRPRNPKLRAVSSKDGLSVPVSVENAGAGVAGAPTSTGDGALERIVNPFLDFPDFGVWRERMTQVEGRVCMVTVGAAAGTGFLVGPDAVLTNHHVLEAPLKANPSKKPTEPPHDSPSLPGRRPGAGQSHPPGEECCRP